MSDWRISSGGRLIKVQIFLLYHRNPDFIRRPARTIHLRFSVPIRLVSGAAAQNPLAKAVHQKAEAAPLCEICGAADHGGAAARTCHERARHGRPVLLQVPVSAGRARGRAAAGGGQLRHPCRARRTVYLESSRSADRYRVQRTVLPSVLQMAVPARRLLRPAEPRFTVSDAGGYA